MIGAALPLPTHGRGAHNGAGCLDTNVRGLEEFAQAVVPGSLLVNATLGGERNALLMVTVQAALGPGGAKATFPAARLYLLDEGDKIKVERVVFFAVPD